MSDAPDRRYEDARMDKLETTIEDIQKEVVKIRIKIFNGFSHKINSTENKVDYIDKQNDKQHGALSDSIKDLSKKFDKILWMFGFSAIGVIIKEVIQGVFA